MIVKYNDKGLSTNVAYSGGWKVRWQRTTALKATFKSLLLPHKHHNFHTFKIFLRYNGKFDIDNTSATIKIFVDAMKEMGMIKEDDTKNFQKLTILYDPTIDNPSFIFEVEEWK